MARRCYPPNSKHVHSPRRHAVALHRDPLRGVQLANLGEALLSATGDSKASREEAEAEAAHVMRRFDVNGDGYLQYDELVAYFIDRDGVSTTLEQALALEGEASLLDKRPAGDATASPLPPVNGAVTAGLTGTASDLASVLGASPRGRELAPIVCPECGESSHLDGSIFCRRCSCSLASAYLARYQRAAVAREPVD